MSWLGAVWIVGGYLTAGALCTIGVVHMWSARHASGAEFVAAKNLSLAGCGTLAIMLFGGFTLVAEAWFELWLKCHGRLGAEYCLSLPGLDPTHRAVHSQQRARKVMATSWWMPPRRVGLSSAATIRVPAGQLINFFAGDLLGPQILVILWL